MPRIILYVVLVRVLILHDCTLLKAQETSHVISAWSGIDSQQENLLHGKIHRGPQLGIGYAYWLQRKAIQSGSVTLTYSRLQTSLHEKSSTGLQIQFSYSYLFNVMTRDGFTFHLGPQPMLLYQVSYFPDWDESHLYWANTLAINVSNQVSIWLINDRYIKLELSLPLAALVSRPEAYRERKFDDFSFSGLASSFHRQVTPSSFLTTGQVNLLIEYAPARCLKSRICWSYNFSWRRISSHVDYSMNRLQHALGLKLYL